MAKRRTLSEDLSALKEKVKATTSEGSEVSSAVRSLKKRLKRIQRKIKLQKQLEDRMKAKQGSSAT